jgi:hypothetical protein
MINVFVHAIVRPVTEALVDYERPKILILVYG